MCESFITISGNLLEQEHLCCAMTDKKHQSGVTAKKGALNWCVGVEDL